MIDGRERRADVRASLSGVRRPRTAALVFLVGGWLGFALATQRWYSWGDGIRLEFAADQRSYEAIARAAPGLPDTLVPLQHAQRLPVHWLLGVVADTGLDLHALYRATSLVLLLALLLVLHLTLSRLGVGPRAHALALGAVAASAFPTHYLLAAPGMVADGVFLLGFALALLGFVERRYALLLGGLVLATLGRQTALPVAALAALWALRVPGWRPRRTLAAAGLLVAPVAAFAGLHALAGRFAEPGNAGFAELTVLGSLDDPWATAEHLARLVPGVLVPAALVAAAWLRTRAPLPRGVLLLAAAVLVQPLLLGPEWTAHNEPRLAALAVPALAVAAAALLRGARLAPAELAVAVAGVAAAGLHHRYTAAGAGRPAVWLALELAGAALVVLAVGRPLRTRGPAGARAGRAAAPRPSCSDGDAWHPPASARSAR